ncbi:6-bladed beta-propeller protein [Pedobacter steynii]|uniref:6-bladed beta-propeller protein n=1 Tax=Pedobacter steynii TaxID=430522 RepID=A0A1H0J8J9_9SPHI|nr:6-bladed beta-propeller [Pedobacter steynii]NQX43059.1 6-bladed beta-propeller [Pedobacter steynii]SDO39860.1 6-bladed beta-propeller protein [Pedobacter steynii]
MENIKKMIIFFCLSMIGIGCNHKKKRPDIDSTKIQAISIPDPGKGIEINLSNFANNVRIISLEYSKESTIGKIKKIMSFKNRYYILDEQNNSGILVYNLNGKYVGKIGKVGKGPSEHINLTDFDIDEYSGKLYMYDNDQNKIIQYNSDGVYIESLVTNHWGDNFAINNDIFYIYRNNSSFGIGDLFVNGMKNSNKEYYFKPIPSYSSLFSERMFSHFNNGIDVTKPYCDTVFFHKEEKMSSKYYIDFGRYKVKQDDIGILFGDDKNKRLNTLIKNKYAYNVTDFYEFQDLAYFSFTSNFVKHYCFYDKKNNIPIYGSTIVNDLNYMFFSTVVGKSQHELFGVYRPDDISSNIDYINTLLKTKDQKIKEKLMSSLTFLNSQKRQGIENLNPAIMVYSLK